MPPGCAWIDPVLISQLPYSCGLSAECTEIIFLKSCAQPSGERQMMANDIFGLIEGSLEVKLPTIWIDEKQSREEVERRERLEERRVEEKESEERRCRCEKR